jgi:pyruvate/2-oxoglutarate dehydrogenase complex dihydrolipoamide acyltransferase (E2) component
MLLESDNVMQNIEVRVDEAIWASTILPEGIVQRWFIADGAIAETGAKIAEIRVEGALHEITSPARGRLTIVAAVNNVVEPGSLLATLAIASIDAHAGD